MRLRIVRHPRHSFLFKKQSICALERDIQERDDMVSQLAKD